MQNKQSKKNKKGEEFFMIGVDEVGRGALAGPVMAAAAMIKNSKLKIPNHKQIRNPKFRYLKRVLNFSHWNLFEICDLEFGFLQNKIKDSKKLSPKKREEIFGILKQHPQIIWGRGLASSKIIDRINILEATRLAMRRAVRNLEKKMGKKFPSDKTVLIVDGNQGIGTGFLEIPIVKADEKLFLCSCASIVAKVKRDALMEKHEKVYSRYGLAKHKGYPTKFHKRMIKKYGFSLIHRKSFKAGQQSPPH